MPRVLAALTVTCLVLAGCGTDDEGDAAPSTTTEGTLPAESTSSSTTTTTEAAATDPAADPDDLPGEVLEMFPYEDANLAVVGVDRDDVLNLRVGPGVDYAVAAELSPIATGLIASGHNRMIGGAIWVEVTVDGETGWVNNSFVLQFGIVDDITSELSELGELPGGETMVDIAETVGALRASDDVDSRIVVIEDPVVGDLGEIMIDVIGLADDAVGGERLHILATPLAGGEGFVVKSVESITLCSRGVTDDFLCL